MVLSSRKYLTEPHLTRAQLRCIRSDLGWAPLWHTAVAAVIILKQQMMHDPPNLLHSRWSSHARPPHGTCIYQALLIQQRLYIPDVALPAKHLTLPSESRKCLFVNCRRQQFLLALEYPHFSVLYLGVGWRLIWAQRTNMQSLQLGGSFASGGHLRLHVGLYARLVASRALPPGSTCVLAPRSWSSGMSCWYCRPPFSMLP